MDKENQQRFEEALLEARNQTIQECKEKIRKNTPVDTNGWCLMEDALETLQALIKQYENNRRKYD